MTEHYILASKNTEQEYIPDRLVADPDTDLDDLEYGDVLGAEYQVWCYPDGDIYEVVPDRELPSGDHFSTPKNTKGEKWKPTLRLLGQDKSKVSDAYNKLSP